MTNRHWLERLNPPQRRAVTHQHGPLLVLAGAGSGKTRVLTRRIAHLIEVGEVAPESIVAVTFTNRAADEMRHRVDSLIEDEEAASRIIISTFHSLGARLLRRYALRADLNWHFSIYDTTDQRRVVSDLLERLGYNRRRSDIRRRRNYIDRCKNRGLTPTEAAEEAFNADAEENAEFYAHYQEALERADAVDFGDLILRPLMMFRRDRRFARRLSNQWQYLMVDEFQDTNPAQYELLEHLTCAHDNLAVVGDDDQSIYRWRGADMTHILGFEEAYESTEVVKLEQNYRSTGVILDAANDVIAVNARRHPKKLWTDRAQGEDIVVFTASDDREEASYVAETIFEEFKKGARPSDFAIFYRTNAQGRLFEEQLRQWGMDYRIVGGLSFYDRREIKDVLAYLRAALNPRDDVATARIINTPRRGIGDKTMEKLVAASDVAGIDDIQDAIDVATDDLPEQSDLFSTPRIDSDAQREAIDALRSLRASTRNSLESFRQLLEEIRDDLLHYESLTTVVERLLERTEYTAHLQKSDPDDADDRLRNIGELIGAIDDFEGDPTTPALLESARKAIPDDVEDPLLTSEAALRLRAFLDRSSLVSQPGDGETDGAVTLMTIHGAKGLEFDTAFLVGMEEKTFPSLRTPDDPEELAEERRLAYVAITRAENRLFITNARRRRVYGKYRNTEPSRFLLDIDGERLHVDARSTCEDVDYGARKKSRRSSWGSQPFGAAAKGAESSFNDGAKAASDTLHFDQSPSDTYEDSFNQALPDWAAPAADDDATDATEEGLVGLTVSHSRFGIGEVLSVSGSGDKARMTVDFATVGEKTVMRQFLKILG